MSEKEKLKKFWKSLTPKEKEGMKRLGAVGIGGAGLALALTYDPEALPLAWLPTATYIQRMRIKKALQKAHILKNKKLRKVV
jgi:hypothetical protein